MTKILATLITALVLLTTSTFAGPRLPLRSIQPVQGLNDDGKLTNRCSSFSIDQKRGYWATAGHCVHPDETSKGIKLDWLLVDLNTDVAVYAANLAPALHLAPSSPAAGDQIMLIGYPLGSIDPMPFFGWFVGANIKPIPDSPRDVFQVIGFPGDSGSPILDNSGRVAGMAQQSLHDIMVHSVGLKILTATLAPFVEEE